MDDVAKITLQAVDDASAQLNNVSNGLKNVQKASNDLGAAPGSLAALKTQAASLNDEIALLAPGTEAFIAKSSELKEVNTAILGITGSFQGVSETTQESITQLDIFKNALKEVNPELGRFGNFEDLIGGAALGVGVMMLADFAKELLNAADQMDIVHNRAEVIYGSDFPAMDAQAEAMAVQLGRNGTDILNFSSQLTLMGEQLGATKTQSEEMGSNLAELGVNLSKAFGGSETDAINAMEMAMEGNTRSLRDYGVALNDKMLQDFADKAGIDEKVSSMDAEQKAMLVYNYLIQNKGQFDEIAAKQSDTLNEATQRLHASWETFTEDMGGQMTGGAVQGVDVLTGAINALPAAINTAKQALENLIPGLQSINMLAASIAGSVGNLSPKGSATFNLQNMLALGKGNIGSAEGPMDLLNPSGGWSGSGKGSSTIQNDLSNLATAYDDTVSKLSEDLTQLDDTHEQKIQSIQNKISSLQDSLSQLDDSYKTTMDGISESLETSFNKQGDAIGKAQDKLVADQKKLAKMQQDAAGPWKGAASIQNNQDIVAMQAQIAADQADISKQQSAYAQMKSKLSPDQLNAATTLAGETPEQITFNSQLAKQTDATSKYQTQKDKLMQSIKDNIVQMAQENQAYGLQRDQIITNQSLLQAWHDQYVGALKDMAGVTKSSVTSMKTDLADLGKLMSPSQAATFGKSAVSSSTNINVTVNIAKVEKTADINQVVQYLSREIQKIPLGA